MKVSKTGLALLAATHLLTALAQGTDSRLAAVSCKPGFVAARESYPFLREDSLTELPDTKLTVESLDFTRLKIFDESNPDENNALFLWANRFHILTRPRIIEQLMLFAEGVVIEGRLLDETARILRNQDYFFDADLRLVSNCE